MMTPDLQNRLWPYIGGVARENHMKALSIGGMQDHVHVLLSLPATLPVAKAVQLIKGGSSKWVHDTFVGSRKFAWQEGYGAFSVNVSLLEETIRYIERQGEPCCCIKFGAWIYPVRNNAPLSFELQRDRKSTRLNSSHIRRSRMPSSA